MKKMGKNNRGLAAAVAAIVTGIVLLLAGCAVFGIYPFLNGNTGVQAKCQTPDITRTVDGPRVIKVCNDTPTIWVSHIQINTAGTAHLQGKVPGEFAIANASVELNITEHGKSTVYSVVFSGPAHLWIAFITRGNPGVGHEVYEPTTAGVYTVFEESLAIPEQGYNENLSFVITAIEEPTGNEAVKQLEATALPIDADLLPNETATTVSQIDGPYRNNSNIQMHLNITAGKRIEVPFFNFDNPLDVPIKLQFTILQPANPQLFLEYRWKLQYGEECSYIDWIIDGQIETMNFTYILNPGQTLQISAIVLLDLPTTTVNTAAVSVVESWNLIH
jgi:hypothetical protein